MTIDTACIGDQVDLSVTINTGTPVINWYQGDTLADLGVTGLTYSPVAVAGQNIYSAIASDPAGCVPNDTVRFEFFGGDNGTIDLPSPLAAFKSKK